MSVVFLSMSVNVENTNHKGTVNYGIERVNEYILGLNQFLQYCSGSIDIIIFDNTVKSIEEYPVNLKNYILEMKKVKFMCGDANKYGKINKGSGLIEQYLYTKDIVKKYDYVIHYEPRMWMNNDTVLKRMMNEDSNFLKFYDGHFFTGFFKFDVNSFYQFIESVDLIDMVKNYSSIEDLLYQYVQKGNIKYSSVNELGVRWHDVKQNKFIVY